jgi:hypothetical protein
LSSIAQAAKEQRLPNRSGAADRGMKLALMLRPENPETWVLARQIGVNHAIVPLSKELEKVTRDKYLDTLTKIKAAYEATGLCDAGESFRDWLHEGYNRSDKYSRDVNSESKFCRTQFSQGE